MTKPYRLSTRKYCPTCGGKAQDPQLLGTPLEYDEVTGAPIWDVLADGTVITDSTDYQEPCDEPYHDKDDPDYQED